jgi:hypothetical protein
MPDIPGPWIINVGGRAYGPYVAEQMRAFALEGRLVAMSQVTRAGDTEFRNALDDPELAPFFIPVKTPSAAVSEPLRPGEAERPASFGRFESSLKAEEDAAPETSHFLIVADMKSRSIQGLEEEVVKLGAVCPIMPQVWMLNTDASISAVRNILIQQLGKLDTLLVVDATRDKAAWFNFGPEMDARIRRIWTKQADSKTRV